MRDTFVEEDLAALAERQHGVVARRQLLALGLGAAAIGRRADAGRLHAIHAGVYAVGHPLLGVYGRWMAAVLACGPGAALGYASGAAMWDLRRGVPSVIDVVVPTAGARARPGLRIHRHPGLASAEVRTERGIRVTTPARTILYYAAVATARELEYPIDQAEKQELTDYPHSMHWREATRGTAVPGACAGRSRSTRPARPARGATSRRRSSPSATSTACRARWSTTRSPG